MIVLGIETSTPVCSVALAQEGELLAEYRLNVRNAHARVLPKAVEGLLADASLKMNDLGGIAVSNGPGSFTGLRIGLSFAKGLGLGLNIPFAAVPTLEALASLAPTSEGFIVPFVKARTDQYMMAVYERVDHKDRIIKEVSVVNSDQLADFIPANAMLIGNHADLDYQADNIRWAEQAFSYPSGYAVARLGWERIRDGQTADLDSIEPDYYQDFVAGKPKRLLVRT